MSGEKHNETSDVSKHTHGTTDLDGIGATVHFHQAGEVALGGAEDLDLRVF